MARQSGSMAPADGMAAMCPKADALCSLWVLSSLTRTGSSRRLALVRQSSWPYFSGTAMRRCYVLSGVNHRS